MATNYYTGESLSADGLNSDQECVLCGYNKLDLIRPYIRQREIFLNSYVVQCPKCLLMQINPTPSRRGLIDFYEKDYRAEGTVGYKEPKSSNRHRSQAKYMLENLKKIKLTPINVVDVCSGHGQLLLILKKELPQAKLFATELDPRIIEGLSENQIFTKKILVEDCERNPFDVQFDLLICSHVLEHAIYPKKFLKVLRSMMSPH